MENIQDTLISSIIHYEDELNEIKSIDEKSLEHNKEIYDYGQQLVLKNNFDENIALGFKLFIHRVLSAEVVNGVCPINIGKTICKQKIIDACEKHGLKHRICQKFSGLPVKFNKNGIKFTATFFKSGKINIVGLNNDAPEYLNRVVSTIKEYQLDLFGEQVMEHSTKRFANRVYAIKIPQLINLSNLQIFNYLPYWKNIKYNSQTFPGVRLKFDGFKSKALVFKTGSMILTGIVSLDCKKKLIIELLNCFSAYLCQKIIMNK